MDDVAEQIGRRLATTGKTVAVAESLTTGNLQAMIGAVSGASVYFQGGVTAYNLDRKVAMLGIDREHAAEVDCVSGRVATEMARGVCERFDANYGIGTTGYAEPANGVQPYAFVAIWKREGVTTGKLIHCARIDANGHSRVEAQQYVASVALRSLLDHLT